MDNMKPGVVVALLILTVVAALGIAWLMSGGDVQCMFSKDPALCASVKEVGR